MAQTPSSPKILFLKQTASVKHWFYELGVDMAKSIGPVEMYTSVDTDRRDGDLTVFRAPPYKKNNHLIRLWTWFGYFVGAARHVFRSPRQALLFFVAQPPYLPLLGYLRNVFCGQKYTIWVDDVMPDLLIRYGRFKETDWIIRWWKKFNCLIYSRAEKVFTLGPCMAALVRQYLKSNRRTKEVVVIPTWVDAEFIKPIDKAVNPFARAHGQADKLTVLYSGNLGLSHDIKTIIAAARLLQTRTDIHFMIIGHGAQWADIATATKELDNLTLLPFQPEETMPFSLATGDIAIVSLDKNYEGISMPSKTYYAMAAGSAVIGLSRPPNDLTMVISENDCGVNVCPGDAVGLANAITAMAANKPNFARLRQNSRRAAVEKYSRAVNTKRVFNEIKSFLQ